MFKIVMIIGAGGFLGSVSRYLAAQFIHKQTDTSFPLGTFLINIVGCLLIGLFYGLSERGNLLTAEWRMFLTVGFCGGFTTFSSFANENITLLKDGQFLYFALYVSLSVFLGLLATFVGNSLTKLW